MDADIRRFVSKVGRFDTELPIYIRSVLSVGREKKSETSNTSREANVVQLAATNPESTHTGVSVSRYQDSTNGRDSVLESKGTHRLSCATLSPPAYQCFLGAQSATPCNDTAHNANAYTIVITMPVGYRREN